MNVEDGKSWILVWNNAVAHNKGNAQYESFAFEEWATKNVGVTWS